MTTNKELALRLARIEGQIAGLRRAIESDAAECTKTLTQAKAASQALKRFTEAFTRAYAKRCIAEKRGTASLSKELDAIISAAYSLS